MPVVPDLGAAPAGAQLPGRHGGGVPQGVPGAAEERPGGGRPLPRGPTLERLARRVAEKKITRAHKATLSKEERKAFRSRKWEMRRDPASLSEEERANLETLFQKIPELRTLHRLRTRFKEIFDTSPDRDWAADALMGLYLEAAEAFPELDVFVKTYERWREQILNYLESGQTSGVVEGINNKARVITKRAYGIKSAQTL
jgi:transposase